MIQGKVADRESIQKREKSTFPNMVTGGDEGTSSITITSNKLSYGSRRKMGGLDQGRVLASLPCPRCFVLCRGTVRK